MRESTFTSETYPHTFFKSVTEIINWLNKNNYEKVEEKFLKEDIDSDGYDVYTNSDLKIGFIVKIPHCSQY